MGTTFTYDEDTKKVVIKTSRTNWENKIKNEIKKTAINNNR